jgi:hypothetical protein
MKKLNNRELEVTMNSVKISRKDLHQIVDALRAKYLKLEDDGADLERVRHLRKLEDELGSLQGNSFKIVGSD